MTGASERMAFADVGRDLIAVSGSRGERRAAGLIKPATSAPPTDFAALAGAPRWLREPRARQITLARLVALRSMAPSLAASIDGAWLGALAEVVGEPALDWALAKGHSASSDAGQSLAPADLTTHGFAILGAHLPSALHAYLAEPACDPATPDPATPDPVAVEDALAFLDGHAA